MAPVRRFTCKSATREGVQNAALDRLVASCGAVEDATEERREALAAARKVRDRLPIIEIIGTSPPALEFCTTENLRRFVTFAICDKWRESSYSKPR